MLVAALAALRDHAGRIAEGRWRWVLVGDGPFRGRLVSAIAAAGLAARVHLAGRLADATLHAWYEAADLFVHPTLYEGSSLVTLEAMAHRRAVVATAAGGLPDKVRHGVSGWLVAPGDASALAAAISGALAIRRGFAPMGTRRTRHRGARVLLGRRRGRDAPPVRGSAGVTVRIRLQRDRSCPCAESRPWRF